MHLKIEIVVSGAQVDSIVNAMVKAAKTGDGKNLSMD
jgi:nitrogen regulatory protein PII